jgi:iron complex transport system permease protein
VLAILIGASLGLCGAALQGLLRNPLADPGLLGVSSGAALGAVIAIYFGLTARFAYAAPLLGLCGALAATGLTMAFGRGGTLSLILAGAAVSGLAGAGVSLALNLAPNANGAYEIMTWLMGSLTDRSWDHVRLAAPFIVLGAAILATTARSLDALSLGEAQAASLGIDLDRLRLTVLIGVTLSVGAATSVAGAIGFVGLVSPHLVRPFVGHQPSRTLLPSALVGAALLLGADIGSRLLRYHGAEIHLGVFTALVGTPFFFWLVVRLRSTAP